MYYQLKSGWCEGTARPHKEVPLGSFVTKFVHVFIDKRIERLRMVQLTTLANNEDCVGFELHTEEREHQHNLDEHLPSFPLSSSRSL